MKNNKKYIILLGDGMADFPIESLGGKTPLEAADTPNMDFLAENGTVGLVKTIPDGMTPGSDIANLSILSYDPEKFYTGRAPFEALNMNIVMGPDDAAFRCNIVSLDNEIMKDFTAGHIETEFSKLLINEVSQNINLSGIEFYPGVSYRNILIWRNYPFKEITDSTPPHDIQGQKISDYIPEGDAADTLNRIMEESKKIIQESLSIKNAQSGYRGNPTSLWIWGGGRKPKISSLKDKYGLYGYTISAVDLIHGIGRAAGLMPLHVNGATGYIDTNYIGKADALLKGLKDANFVCLHVESPDESGHEGNIEHKIMAIEDFDKKVVGQVIKRIDSKIEYTLLVMPDHPTPIKLRTHTSDPVPFCIYRKNNINNKTPVSKNPPSFSESSAAKTGIFIERAHHLIELMIND